MITWRAHSLGDANHANRIPVLTGPRFGDEINQPRRCYQRLQRPSAASAAQRFFRNVGEGLEIARPLMPLMGADTADQRAMESMRQTTIIIVAAATNKLLFISGFSAFSGFSGQFSEAATPIETETRMGDREAAEAAE